MKRTTIMLPDELDASLRLEARRRGSTIADVVREAVTTYFARTPPRRLSFVALGEGAVDDSERVDEIVGAAIRRSHGEPANGSGDRLTAVGGDQPGTV